MNRAFVLLVLVLATNASCGDDASGHAADAAPSGPDATPPAMDFSRDILTTDLHLDVTALTGRAAITIAPSTTSTSASFEAKGLTITAVTGPDGPLAYAVSADGRLDVAVPAGEAAPEIDVDYTFTVHHAFDGYLPEGMTFIWPYFCSNLFPCKSAPDDGVKFRLDVTGVPTGKTAIFPTTIPADAPSYMLAFAIDDYTRLDLGTTTAGTAVHVWYRPGQQAIATDATTHLAAEFDFYERTYGPYSFGHDVGTVSTNWGAGAVGGMEHHPYWHIGELNSAEVHAHEAAHSWYGDGVRIGCWEDFVLSEGTVSYLAARAVEAEDSLEAGNALWDRYKSRLDQAVLLGDTPAWPDGCDQIDLLHDKLWSDIPYMKGAPSTAPSRGRSAEC
jgi:aminopeptidase N